jgi:hypothetical protein
MQFVALKVIGPSVLGASGSYHIATVSRHMDNPEAYAALFAAALDLLSALKECALEIAQIRNRRLTWGEQVALDAARDAIAKAEGRST